METVAWFTLVIAGLIIAATAVGLTRVIPVSYTHLTLTTNREV